MHRYHILFYDQLDNLIESRQVKSSRVNKDGKTIALSVKVQLSHWKETQSKLVIKFGASSSSLSLSYAWIIR